MVVLQLQRLEILEVLLANQLPIPHSEHLQLLSQLVEALGQLNQVADYLGAHLPPNQEDCLAAIQITKPQALETLPLLLVNKQVELPLLVKLTHLVDHPLEQQQ